MLESTEKDEIKGIEKDNMLFENTSNLNKSMFSEHLLSGLGEQMISYLKEPPRPKKTTVIKYKIKNALTQLFEVL